MKKRMLFVFTVLLMLLPINYLSAGITDTEGKTTNSKTTVVDHYNDKIENMIWLNKLKFTQVKDT